MTRFLHITDLHVTAPGVPDKDRESDTVATLDRLIACVTRMRPAPAFIVASGDLTNVGDEASYALLKDRFARLDVPVIMTLGNHDRRGAWHRVFPGHPAAPEGPVDHEAVVEGVHIIALDSSVPGKVSGALSAEQLAQAAGSLAQHPELPKVVAVHHPPKLRPGAAFSWATIDQDSTDGLAAVLAPHKIAALLSGHVHMNRFAMWNDVPLIVNTGHQSTVDVTRPDTLAIVEGSGFAICDLLRGGVSVTFASLETPRLIKKISLERLRLFM